VRTGSLLGESKKYLQMLVVNTQASSRLLDIVSSALNLSITAKELNSRRSNYNLDFVTSITQIKTQLISETPRMSSPSKGDLNLLVKYYRSKPSIFVDVINLPDM